MVNQGADEQPHVAVCAGAGMCHLVPCLSLAAALSSSDCMVTLVIVVPLASAAEASEISSFLASHPDIHRLDFHMDSRPNTKGMDPFLARYDALSHSADHLGRHLPTLSPPLSAVFSEFSLTRGVNTTLPVSIPNYTIVPVSARFFSIMAWLPHMHAATSPLGEVAAAVEIPGIGSVPRENLPPPYFNPDHIFNDLVVSNARHLHLSKGIVLNTFEAFEPDALAALRGGKVVQGLPPLFPFAPLNAARKRPSQEASKVDETLTWLDAQPDDSVIYVAFGSRTAMPRDQIRELGMGLKRSGCRFLWVVKSTIVDVEEKDGLEELLGRELYEALVTSGDGKGKLVRNWVRQDEILGHRAVGGFLSHSGWSSMLEAARHGVSVLAWPLGGDQRENAWTVNKVGLGIWDGWGADKLVTAAEIANKVERLMKDEALKKGVARIKEEAHKACEVGGTSTTALLSIVQILKG